ncbi:MAG: hypothetical protein V1847_02905 [Candidatus Diapherotrites archaeon]
MLPELEFKRSRIYERTLLRLAKKEPMARLKRPVLLETFGNLEARKPELTTILKEITKILGINWKRKSIRIYCLSFREHGTTFSDPLTVSLCTSKGQPAEIENLVDLITHELIHNAFEEISGFCEIVERLKKDFPNLPEDAHSHILLHAVHSLIYKKFSNLEQFEADKKKAESHSELASAWKIVEQEGAETLVSKYLK